MGDIDDEFGDLEALDLDLDHDELFDDVEEVSTGPGGNNGKDSQRAHRGENRNPNVSGRDPHTLATLAATNSATVPNNGRLPDWVCRKCTLLNKGSATFCIVCQDKAPATVARKAKTQWGFMNGYSQGAVATSGNASRPKHRNMRQSQIAGSTSAKVRSPTKPSRPRVSAQTAQSGAHKQQTSSSTGAVDVPTSIATVTAPSNLRVAHERLRPRDPDFGRKARPLNQTSLAPPSASSKVGADHDNDIDVQEQFRKDWPLPPATPSDNCSDPALPQLDTEAGKTWEYPTSDVYEPRK